MTGEELARELRDEARSIRERDHWNYDHIENKVTYGVCAALEGLADRLDNK
jgi:hypothetical protein